MANTENKIDDSCSCSKKKKKHSNIRESNDCSAAVSYLNDTIEPVFRQGVCSIDDREDTLSRQVAKELNNQESKEGKKVTASLDYIAHQVKNMTTNLRSFVTSMQTTFDTQIDFDNSEMTTLNSFSKSMGTVDSGTKPQPASFGSIMGYIADFCGFLAFL